MAFPRPSSSISTPIFAADDCPSCPLPAATRPAGNGQLDLTNGAWKP
jgi:hypothetical protein